VVSTFVYPAYVTEFYIKVIREKTWDVYLYASLDFSGFVPPSQLCKFAWSPHQTKYYFDPAMDRGIKIVRQLKIIPRGIRQVGQRSEGTEVSARMKKNSK